MAKDISEKIALYKGDIEKFDGNCDDDLLNAIVKHIRPSIFHPDGEKVSCSEKKELETVRENFLKKKLGLSDSDSELDTAIKEVCEKLGSSNKNKYRATFYYLLAKRFDKKSVF